MYINMIEFIKQRRTLSGELKIVDLERITELLEISNAQLSFTLHTENSLAPQANVTHNVQVNPAIDHKNFQSSSIQSKASRNNVKNRTVLCLSICGKITTLCQNCLSSIDIELNCNLTIPVFSSEEEFNSALLNKDNAECDGIVAQAQFDALTFIEDEIIMQLPIAPKHENCHKAGTA